MRAGLWSVWRLSLSNGLRSLWYKDVDLNRNAHQRPLLDCMIRYLRDGRSPDDAPWRVERCLPENDTHLVLLVRCRETEVVHVWSWECGLRLRVLRWSSTTCNPREAMLDSDLVFLDHARCWFRSLGPLAIPDVYAGTIIVCDIDDTLREMHNPPYTLVEHLFDPDRAIAGAQELLCECAVRGCPIVYLTAGERSIRIHNQRFLVGAGFPPGRMYDRPRSCDDPYRFKTAVVSQLKHRYRDAHLVGIGDCLGPDRYAYEDGGAHRFFIRLVHPGSPRPDEAHTFRTYADLRPRLLGALRPSGTLPGLVAVLDCPGALIGGVRGEEPVFAPQEIAEDSLLLYRISRVRSQDGGPAWIRLSNGPRTVVVVVGRDGPLSSPSIVFPANSTAVTVHNIGGCQLRAEPPHVDILIP